MIWHNFFDSSMFHSYLFTACIIYTISDEYRRICPLLSLTLAFCFLTRLWVGRERARGEGGGGGRRDAVNLRFFFVRTVPLSAALQKKKNATRLQARHLFFGLVCGDLVFFFVPLLHALHFETESIVVAYFLLFFKPLFVLLDIFCVLGDKSSGNI